MRALALDLADRVALGQFDEVCDGAMPGGLSASGIRHLLGLWGVTPRRRSSHEPLEMDVSESLETELASWWVDVGMWTVQETRRSFWLRVWIEKHEDGLRYRIWSLWF